MGNHIEMMPKSVTFQAIYMFAGQHRRAGLKESLEQAAREVELGLRKHSISIHCCVEECDIHQGGASHDLDNSATQEAWLKKVEVADLTVTTPPCCTISRAPYSNSFGPAPIRSFEWPLGFPWNDHKAQARCDKGSRLMLFSLRALEKAATAEHKETWRRGRGLLEHPEDLGDTSRGTPASIFQFRETRELGSKKGWYSGAFFQCETDESCDYLKPTRVVTSIPMHDNQAFHVGWPAFQKGWLSHQGGWRTQGSRCYAGPLPRTCIHQRRHKPLIGREGDGFATTPTAAWPKGLCDWVAKSALNEWAARLKAHLGLSEAGEVSLVVPPMVSQSWQGLPSITPTEASKGSLEDAPQPPPGKWSTLALNSAKGSGKGIAVDGAETIDLTTEDPPEREVIEKAGNRDFDQYLEIHGERLDDSDTEPDSEAAPKLAGWRGLGPPLMVSRGLNRRGICDGLGLCSPGRWAPEARRLPAGKVINGLGDRIINLLRTNIDTKELLSKMAVGKCTEDPFPVDMTSELRHWAREQLQARGVNAVTLANDTRQPIDVRLVQGLLEDAKDPDHKVMNSFAVGVPTGINDKLPRTPAVYVRKVKWALAEQADPDSEPELESEAVWRDNYSSARAMKASLKEQLEEKVGKGQILKQSEEAAWSRWGNELIVASLGAQEKTKSSDGSTSVRILYDGTHGVQVNKRIRVRDQDRCPTAVDIKRVQRQQALGSTSIFGLVADVAEAHNIVQVKESDWPKQSCQLEPGGEVYSWKVGTFGVASAAYWWSRMGGAVGRLTMYGTSALTAAPWISLMADDFRLEAQGAGFAEGLLYMIWLFVILGVPLQWKKLKGGVVLQWVGYELLLREHALGISQSRADWLANWYTGLLRDRTVLVGKFSEGLGRAAFVYGALEYERPFLAPLYAFAALHAKESVRPLPLFALVLIQHMLNRLKNRRHYPSAAALQGKGEPFRVDAKAEGNIIGIGGWLPVRDKDGAMQTMLSPWFSEELTESNAGWAYYKSNQPNRVIASLEAVGALMALVAFGPTAVEGQVHRCCVEVPGFTDNQGNSHALNRLMSSKYPLVCVIMELAAQLEKRGARMDVSWTPRELNDEADRLSNFDTTGFDPQRRIRVRPEKTKWLVLNEVLESGQEFYRERVALQESRRGAPLAAVGRKRKRDTRLRVTDPW